LAFSQLNFFQSRRHPLFHCENGRAGHHLQGRQAAFLFETNRHTRYSTRTVQSIVTNCARAAADIDKRVYPQLLRHSIATILLDSGLVPIDQVQKFLGHLNLSTTQIYAETSLRALGDNYVGAMGGKQ
jgi:integrase/recombinase XerD